jgi:hypothetical protein
VRDPGGEDEPCRGERRNFTRRSQRSQRIKGFEFRPFDPDLYHGDPKIFGLASRAIQEVRTIRAAANKIFHTEIAKITKI